MNNAELIQKQRKLIIDSLINEIEKEKENNNNVIISNISFFKIDYKEKNNTIQVIKILTLFYGIDICYLLLTYKYKLILSFYNQAKKNNNKRLLCSFLFLINKCFFNER